MIRKSPTYWNDAAFFFEDVLHLTAPLELVTGGRYGRLALNRQNFNTLGQPLSNGFERTYDLTNWRVGLLYSVRPGVRTYLAWTTGKDPAGTSDLFDVNAPDTDDTLMLDDYLLADLYAPYRVKPGVLVTARVRNLADTAYARWADIYYPAQIMLGEPRSYELALYMTF